MKHFTLLKTWLTVLLLLVRVGTTWAEDKTVTWKASSGALGTAISSVNGTATGTISTGSFSWSYTRTLTALAKNKSDYISYISASGYIQLGSGNASQDLEFRTSNIPGIIKSISIECASNGTSPNPTHSLSVTVGGSSYDLEPVKVPFPSISNGSITAGGIVSATGSSSGEIVISFTGNKVQKALYIKSISVTYAEETVTIPYTVTFNAGTNGSCLTSSITEETAGAGVTLPSCTAIANYKFVGWSTSATPTSADAGKAGDTYYPTEDNTPLYAYYVPIYTLTITQPEAGGTLTVKAGDTPLASGATVEVGTDLTCAVSNVPEGKRFSRFYVTYDGGENKYKATNPATFDNLPISGITAATVTVTYQDVQYYTVNYVINGVNTGAQENVEEKTELVFPTPAATINGKVFRGWTETPIYGTTNEAPLLVNPVGLKATANKTYYAVYATQEGNGDPNVLTSVSGTITSGEYYLVDTYTREGVVEYWAAQGGVANQGVTTKQLSDGSYTLADDGTLSIDLSKITNANMPSLYTITIGTDDVVLKQGDNYIYATYSTSTNNVNASLMGTIANNTMNWNSIVGTGVRHQIKAVKGDERILMLMDKTSSGNEAHYLKSYAESNSNTGGAGQNCYGSGNLYFLQAGVATYSDFTTLPDAYLRENLTAGNYFTVCLPKASAAISGAEVYSIAGKNVNSEEVVTSIMVTEETSMEAGVPYICKATADKFVVSYAGSAVTTAGNNNGLYGSFERFAFADWTGFPDDVYVISSNKVQAVNNEGGVNANRAYIIMSDVPEYNPQAGVKAFRLGIDGMDDYETGVNNIASEDGNEKVVYNLSGQRVSKPTRGIYVINGKKVIIK